MSKPRMCPHCRAFVDSRSKTCEYCDNPLPMTAGRRLVREERLRRVGAQGGFTTMILLLINAALFAVSWILTLRLTGNSSFLGGIDGQVLHLLGAKFSASIQNQGEWWRLITANFLHGGVLHLAFNTMSLYNLGPLAEEIFGTSRFLVLYLATGFCGFLASTLWSNSLSIGASASICGLIGALYAYGRINFNSQLRSAALRWIIAIGVFGLLFPAIDNAAHLGGLAAGLGFAYICGSAGHDANREAIWKGLAIGVAGIAAAAFLLAYRNFSGATS